MTQSSFWQTNKQNNDFAELCNALYEREIHLLANAEVASIQNIQGRLKSLSHYINRTANRMVYVNELGLSPLTLDVQNATWSAKQASKLSVLLQNEEDILSWYLTLISQTNKTPLGLVVPILRAEHIVLDSIDRVDTEKKRVRTNVSGWFSLSDVNVDDSLRLLKPTKKVMLAACAGHQWQGRMNTTKLRPIMPSLRELLISCTIDWQNFKRPLAL
ncbi:hypothetical protein [Candidatus Colwellia aromaticivorans]|uniref:hypothetical protein n=1 Tax=Candidatus Colwellia aromaticivorans TaxID=2267621 RepID=UPI000DF1F63F|nr:hypothetical protein [Candidatus Colwellia aromaticivorans]